MKTSDTYTIENGQLLIDDTAHIHRAGILKKIETLCFLLADEVNTLEQFGLIEKEPALKRKVQALYDEFRREAS